MKKSIFTIVLLACGLAFFTQLSAQTKTGLAVGYVHTHWDMPVSVPSEEGEWSTAGGLYLSLPIEHSFSKNLAFQGEIAWAQKGASVKLDMYVDGIYVKAKGTTLVDYLEIPAMLKFSTGSGKTRLYGFAGGYLAYGLKANITTTATATYQDQKETFTDAQELDFEELGFSRTDFGLLTGAGVRFGKIFVEARYTHGMADMDTSEGPEAVIHNRGLVFSLGYFF